VTNNPELLQRPSPVFSQGKDITIIEGSLDQAELLAAISGASVVVIHDYACDLEEVLPLCIRLSGSWWGLF